MMHGQADGKGSALTFLACGADGSTMLENDLAHTCQPNTVAADPADVPASLKALENAVQIVWRDADT